MSFRTGQRVTTTVDAPAAWTGAHAAPTDSRGTISSQPSAGGTSYGVVLDDDPAHMPASYTADELTAE